MMFRSVSGLLAICFVLCVCCPATAEVIVGTPQDFYQRGCKMLEQGLFKEAVEELTKAIDLAPEMTEAYFERGRANRFLEKYDAAINDFSFVISRDPENYRAQFYRASSRFLNKNFKGALLDISTVLKMKKKYSPAWELKGDIYFVKGDLQGAKVAYDRAIEYSPGVIECVIKRAKVHIGLGLPDEAIKDCNTVLEKSPELFEVFFLRAEARKQKGDFAGAEADINVGMRYDIWKDNPATLFDRAMCRMLQGMFDQATADLRSAMTLPGKMRMRCALHLTLLLVLTDRRVEAVNLANKYLELGETLCGKAEFESKWSYLLRFLKDDIKEVELVDIIIKDLENKELACFGYYSIGVMNLARGKLIRTLDALNKSCDLGDPRYPEYNQAKYLYKLVDTEKMKCPPKYKKVQVPEITPRKPSPENSPEK